MFEKLRLMWINRKCKVYISGKITGLDNYEEIFNNAEKQLRSLGYTKIINPVTLSKKLSRKMKLPVEFIDYNDFLRYDLKHLCDCTLLYVLKNYKDSKGALIEIDLAEKLGLIIIFEK